MDQTCEVQGEGVMVANKPPGYVLLVYMLSDSNMLKMVIAFSILTFIYSDIWCDSFSVLFLLFLHFKIVFVVVAFDHSCLNLMCTITIFAMGQLVETCMIRNILVFFVL